MRPWALPILIVALVLIVVALMEGTGGFTDPPHTSPKVEHILLPWHVATTYCEGEPRLFEKTEGHWPAPINRPPYPSYHIECQDGRKLTFNPK